MSDPVSTSALRRLVLLDGHANVFRAYFAIKATLTTSTGEPTHAVLGFLSMLLRLRKALPLDHVAVVFDAAGPTFRHDAFEAYKATRRETPPDLHTQCDRIRQVLTAMKVPICEAPGFEADDLLGTLAVRAVREGGEAIICSVDKDILQVAQPGITVWRDHLGNLEKLDAAGVYSKLGVRPDQVADYLAMVGDTADNIPGLPGVGPKTAVALLEEFGTLEELIRRQGELPEKKKKLRETVAEFGERALGARLLTRLDLAVPCEFRWEDFAWQLTPTEELRQLLIELEFGRLLNEFGFAPVASAPPSAAPKPAPKPAPTRDTMEGEQGSLFGEEESAEAPTESTAPTMGVERHTDYRAIRTMEELQSAVAAIRAAGLCAIDTETTGFDPFTSTMVGLSLSWAHNQGVYIPVAHQDGTSQLSLPEVRSVLDPLFSDGAVRLVAHHWNFDLKVLLAAGFHLDRAAADTLLEAFLLSPDRNQGGGHGLKALAMERLGVAMTPISDLIGTGKSQRSMADVPSLDVTPYASADADLTLQLHRYFSPRLDEAELRPVYEDIELPLTPVLARMETEGIRIDPDYFAAFGREVEGQLERLVEEIHEMAGEPFNINSPKQVGEILFLKRKLPSGKKTKSGFSTDVSVLEDLAKLDPLPGKILEYRMFEKLRGTYIEALPKAINPVTDRVHTSYSQTDAATGRLASNSPNLQNIPVRTEEGRRIRQGFLARSAGWKLLAADYSQIELRILAHISGDPALQEAYREGRDIHALTASKVLGVPLAEVTSAQRGSAKAINFGIVYGMGANGLANDLGISVSKAKQFIADYFAAYSGVKKYMDDMVAYARTHGYVRTLSGRRRPIPDIHASLPTRRHFAERIAINTPIQGTSADMIKIAMIRIDARIRREKLPARMLLQVHDELIFDVPVEELDAMQKLVREEMESAMPLDVPVQVDMAVGDNWAEV